MTKVILTEMDIRSADGHPDMGMHLGLMLVYVLAMMLLQSAVCFGYWLQNLVGLPRLL